MIYKLYTGLGTYKKKEKEKKMCNKKHKLIMVQISLPNTFILPSDLKVKIKDKTV